MMLSKAIDSEGKGGKGIGAGEKERGTGWKGGREGVSR